MRPLRSLAAALALTLTGCLDYLFDPLPPEGFARPVLVSTTLRFVDIAAGGGHTCAVTATGVVYCWGKSEHGELGSSRPFENCGGPGAGSLGFTCTGSPQRVEGVPALVSIAVSMSWPGFSCGLTAGGAAWCWGFGVGGHLGNGMRASSAVPVAVSGGLSFSTLSVGAKATCGLATDGHTYCWGPGAPSFGTASVTGDVPSRTTADSLRFASVEMGELHGCGLTAAGSAYCWGSNWYGTLGMGEAGGLDGLAGSAIPVAVLGGHTFASLSVGSAHSCGLTTGGETYCWGSSSLVENAEGYVSIPTRVTTPGPFVSLHSGFLHACGRTASNELYCWGQNYSGTLGDGTRSPRRRPTRVQSSVPFVRASRTCALAADGAAYCWGGNEYGQVGRRPGTSG